MFKTAVKTFRSVATVTLSLLGLSAGAEDAPPKSLYRLESALTIPSPNAPNWDYLTLDPARGYLYIARRDDGVLIYDTAAKKVAGAIENTKGGNATVLVPEFDRGYVINEDGSTTAFAISTLKTIGRTKIGDDADSAFYDPVTKQLMVTMGDSHQVLFLDAKTGAVTGKLAIDSSKIEGSAADGRGGFFTALRDRNQVIRVDAREKKITSEWSPQGCALPTAVAFDSANRRVFVGCRGENPILAVLDADTGRVVAKPAIGRGNDNIVFDGAAQKIYTANGFDGTLVIIDQVDADTYKLAEAVTTRPYARTMAVDFKTKKVYLVTAEGTVDPSKPWKAEVAPFYPNTYFRNTFTLLTYAPRSANR